MGIGAKADPLQDPGYSAIAEPPQKKNYVTHRKNYAVKLSTFGILETGVQRNQGYSAIRGIVRTGVQPEGIAQAEVQRGQEYSRRVQHKTGVQCKQGYSTNRGIAQMLIPHRKQGIARAGVQHKCVQLLVISNYGYVLQLLGVQRGQEYSPTENNYEKKYVTHRKNKIVNLSTFRILETRVQRNQGYSAEQEYSQRVQHKTGVQCKQGYSVNMGIAQMLIPHRKQLCPQLFIFGIQASWVQVQRLIPYRIPGIAQLLNLHRKKITSPTEKIMLSSYPLLGFWKQGCSAIRGIAQSGVQCGQEYSQRVQRKQRYSADRSIAGGYSTKQGYSANRGIAQTGVQHKC